MNEESQWNKYLKLSALSKITPDNQKHEIEVLIKNPDAIWDKSRDSTINGTVYVNSGAIKIHPDIPDDVSIVVADHGFSILQYNSANQPIKVNEVRFLRWFFSPKQSTINNPPFIHRFILNIINELYYNYIIAGPNELINWLYERIEIEISKKSTDSKVKTSNESLISFLNTNNGVVRYGYWRFILFPRKLRALFNFFKKGIIEPLGGLQNFNNDIPEPPNKNRSPRKRKKLFFKNQLWPKRAYYWEADANSPFLLYFTAKVHNRWYKLLPYIALLCCLTTIIFSFKIIFYCIVSIPTYIWDFLISIYNFLSLKDNPFIDAISALLAIVAFVGIAYGIYRGLIKLIKFIKK